jgi:hypothetical protein
MIRRILVILILSFFITSCGGAAPEPTEATATEIPDATEAPTQSVIGEISTPTAQNTSTPAPTNTPAPTATDTPLPPLELPTEAVSAPARMVWDGTPTYLGDSTPGYSFRVTYDPEIWALTTDQFGFPALGHRNISYCVISVTSGRGLPANVTVEHDILDLGSVTFDVGTIFENGVKRSVTYTGGDGNIITAFEVSFQDESDACLADAVNVLATLRSVRTSQATPVP